MPSMEPRTIEVIPLQDALVSLQQNWLAPSVATHYQNVLNRDVPWRRPEVTLFGRRMPTPRDVAWFGDTGITYRYSGLEHRADGWLPELSSMRDRLYQETGIRFNSVLVNRYCDGDDSMGWHSDNEPELGGNPPVASVSIGESRRFLMRHRFDDNLRQEIELTSGSLLLMLGATQHHWRHSIPKTKRPKAQRINLTFRRIIPR